MHIFSTGLNSSLASEKGLAKDNGGGGYQENGIAGKLGEVHELNATINPKTNLAHCFCCGQNLNNIDLLLSLGYRFGPAVAALERLLHRYRAHQLKTKIIPRHLLVEAASLGQSRRFQECCRTMINYSKYQYELACSFALAFSKFSSNLAKQPIAGSNLCRVKLGTDATTI